VPEAATGVGDVAGVAGYDVEMELRDSLASGLAVALIPRLKASGAGVRVAVSFCWAQSIQTRRRAFSAVVRWWYLEVARRGMMRV
jgi:hypothetical protein